MATFLGRPLGLGVASVLPRFTKGSCCRTGLSPRSHAGRPAVPGCPLLLASVSRDALSWSCTAHETSPGSRSGGGPLSSYSSSISSAQLMDRGSSCTLAVLGGGLASLVALPCSVAGGPWSSSKRYTVSWRIRIFNCIEEVPRFFFAIEFNSSFQISNYLHFNCTPDTI